MNKTIKMCSSLQKILQQQFWKKGFFVTTILEKEKKSTILKFSTTKFKFEN